MQWEGGQGGGMNAVGEERRKSMTQAATWPGRGVGVRVRYQGGDRSSEGRDGVGQGGCGS